MEIIISDKDRYKKRRWLYYFGAFILQCMISIANVIFWQRADVMAMLYIAGCLTIGGGVLAWCTYDSLARGIPLSPRKRLWIGLLGPIFVPWYFYQSRGLSQGIKSAFGLALYAPFYAAFYGLWYLTAALLTYIGYYS